MITQVVCPDPPGQDLIHPQYVKSYHSHSQALIAMDLGSDLINFVFFQGFLLYIHYMRENAERRLYTLRDQLKVQFRATQKAQVNERKAADSKRRLTSYVTLPPTYLSTY